jgi:leucyl-tRNA synthetase
MDEKYFPEKIEEKWQRRWAESGAFEVEHDDSRPKFYCLEMLPYPSGFLHMGHVRNYAIGDALSWFKRLQGFNVIHPIGWDSFGQPAEQAAIKRGVMPRDWTEQNIAHMRAQLRRLGVSYDWRREIAAHTPEYYKWDQWFFLKMLERGLIYRKNSPVNWCPREETVLSNEQSSGGVCWRCGAAVEKRDLEQWFVRTTDYAEELLEGMKEIEAGWPERVLTMQRNWIGKSTGAYIDFQVKDSDEKIRVFTTRIDTIYGATAVVVSTEHPVVGKSLLRDEVSKFVERTRAERMAAARQPGEDVEKEGVATGLFALNPFSGEQVPVWVANYVLMEYGTGAVMAVPAHDERDFEFAQKYSLPIRRVIERISHEQEQIDHDPVSEDQSVAMPHAFTDYGILVNSADWSGKLSGDAIPEMAEFAQQQGFGEAAVTYRLRDWGISRQRFWGAPIPIVYCDRCGAVPVPEDQLPVLLPERAEFTGEGGSPLANVEEFVNTRCPKCAGAARRETDTMDTFVDSSWYFFRYTDPRNDGAPFDPKVAGYWTPVDQYIGGVEHAVMHLLYTRFWTKFMRDVGLVSFDEPVKNLMTQGMVVAETFYREGEGGQKTYFNPADVRVERDEKGRVARAVSVADGEPVSVGPFEKMSKSVNNGVDPDEMVRAFGADATRLFSLFAAPIENDLRWQEAGIDGALRFLRRVHSTVFRWRGHLKPSANESVDGPAGGLSDAARSLRRKTHQTILRVTDDFEGMHFNTAIAALMELMNELQDSGLAPESVSAADAFAVREALEATVLMIAPFAPHFAEEAWEGMHRAGGLLGSGARWPAADPELARRESLEIPVQVNGKLRTRVIASPDATEDELRAMALADEKVRAFAEGKQIVKVVVVPARLVNVVVK